MHFKIWVQWHGDAEVPLLPLTMWVVDSVLISGYCLCSALSVNVGFLQVLQFPATSQQDVSLAHKCVNVHVNGGLG